MKDTTPSLDARMAALGASALFAGLAPEALSELAGGTVERSFDSGAFLFRQGQEADGFYIVVEGELNVHRQGMDGREQVLHIFGAGEVCGEVPVFQGSDYPASAVATRRTRALYLPRSVFADIAERNPGVLMAMLASLSKRLRQFVDLIDDLSLKDVSARLARHLLSLAEQQGRPVVRLESTKAMLASRLGTAPETLSRVLRKMQAGGMIQVNGRDVVLLDRDQVAELAEGVKL